MSSEKKTNDEATEKVEEVQEIRAEKPFEEQLSEAVGQSVEQFYKDLLVNADTRIKAQQEQIMNLQQQQLEFRDEIAMRLYIPLIDRVSSNEQAANSAYQAADAFLRARENGIIITTAEEAEEQLTDN